MTDHDPIVSAAPKNLTIEIITALMVHGFGYESGDTRQLKNTRSGEIGPVILTLKGRGSIGEKSIRAVSEVTS